MPFIYEYPHPAVATDIAVFTLRRGALNVLLIERGAAPYLGAWALPGGFLQPDEELDQCARRELLEETGVDADLLMQFATFSAPDRDPRERVISVAYLALLASDELRLEASTDAAQARWFPIGDLPELAFDHDTILRRAFEVLGSRARQISPLFALLPARFTLSQLQGAYEAVTGEDAEKRNFRKTVATLGCVRETDDFAHGAHRPARLYEPVV
ncbi:MAG: NUDIX hydrolase [Alphaproteobacteria bacterium]|nr:NUDIX hydrolase [Alphaproteobacteria bacterium]MBU1516200.1 NUDIX hydrolase [Alphaproteobacteria bacterium]MBU2093510.1 NUDIX hydrolase [Alphaproteobacteria bacterium]MBU2153552.1 NUDIX hydrolase [Alphaproteobacteria bacterium]MBU2308172.1 NUDIX hydrolase [Alphaproteobacteria bacterium]